MNHRCIAGASWKQHRCNARCCFLTRPRYIYINAERRRLLPTDFAFFIRHPVRPRPGEVWPAPFGADT